MAIFLLFFGTSVENAQNDITRQAERQRELGTESAYSMFWPMTGCC